MTRWEAAAYMLLLVVAVGVVCGITIGYVVGAFL